MSEAQMQNFDQRLRRIDERHRKLARGIEISVTRDGLLVARPAVERFVFPWRGLLMVLVTLMIFKGFLHAQIGAASYDDRVARLAGGTVAEQAGAWFMKPDPLTLWISARIEPLTF